MLSVQNVNLQVVSTQGLGKGEYMNKKREGVRNGY